MRIIYLELDNILVFSLKFISLFIPTKSAKIRSHSEDILADDVAMMMKDQQKINFKVKMMHVMQFKANNIIYTSLMLSVI